VNRAGIARRGVASLLLAVAVSLSLVAPAVAVDSMNGYRNCNLFITFLHERYNDIAGLNAPGTGTTYYWDFDGQWHVHEKNGDYQGSWMASADPYLDHSGTYAGCRKYG
jgi:hypothetical protein